MKRLSIFVYGVTCYTVFLATFLYFVGFMANVWVGKSIDSLPTAPLMTALLTNLALVAVFGIQHSVMARPAFKRWWTHLVPECAERSTYVLLASLALFFLVAFWQPMGGVVWTVASPIGRIALHGAFVLGCALLLLSTFLINHFDLFGLRQVWLQLLGEPYQPVPFRAPALYRYVRHPLYLGLFFIFWAAPTMTVAHLVLAIAMSTYVLIAIPLEERDLIVAHPEYADYRRRVPMLLPFVRRPQKASPRAAVRGG